MFANATSRAQGASISSVGMAPTPISDVQSQVLRLEESTAGLESTVASLISRLESVLTPDRLVNAEVRGETTARVADTALSQQLYGACCRVENMQARVSEVIARLGI